MGLEPGWLGLGPGWLAGLASGLAGWLGLGPGWLGLGPGWLGLGLDGPEEGGQMNNPTDGRTENLPILQDFIVTAAAQKRSFLAENCH